MFSEHVQLSGQDVFNQGSVFFVCLFVCLFVCFSQTNTLKREKSKVFEDICKGM